MIDEVPTLAKAIEARDYGIQVGSGCSRVVYWDGKSRWAYKFQGYYGGRANRQEFDNYKELMVVDLDSCVKIPEMQLLEDEVLAIEYINGKSPDSDCYGGSHSCNDKESCWYTKINGYYLEYNVSGFFDIHLGNVVQTDNGDIYVVDLEM